MKKFGNQRMNFLQKHFISELIVFFKNRSLDIVPCVRHVHQSVNQLSLVLETWTKALEKLLVRMPVIFIVVVGKRMDVIQIMNQNAWLLYSIAHISVKNKHSV